jgi:hypothetical protein
VPTTGDVRIADQTISAYFAVTRPPAELERWPELSQLNRQYLGVVRKRLRTVYVSYMPLAPPDDDEWRRAPDTICDGGPGHFGAEIDLASLQVIQIAFDSCLCTVVSSNYGLERAVNDKVPDIWPRTAAAQPGR